MLRLCRATLVLALALGGAAPVVHLRDQGYARGVTRADGTTAFLGIPYAQPPTGARRWQPPAPPLPWHGVRNATDPGPACLAGPSKYSQLETSEDCLHVHVFTRNIPPQRARASEFSELKPVMVWLHGGGLVEGSGLSIQSGYGAVANLTSNNDVIVVAVEYRLAVAGFLALDALADLERGERRDNGCVGNYGLLDVQQALRWVQHNAAAFGGDPLAVTVFGQSSGGSLVFALAASPASKGLLHRGFSLSGSPRLNSTTQEAASYWHREAVKRTRCGGLLPPEGSRSAALGQCLLSLNSTELTLAMPDDWHTEGFGFEVFRPDWRYAPLLLIDGPGCALPRDYMHAFDVVEGRNAAVATRAPDPIPLLVGVTREESDFSPGDDVRGQTEAAFSAFVRAKLEPAYGVKFVTELLGAYLTGAERVSPGGADAFDAQKLYSDIVTDATILCPNAYLSATWQRAACVAENTPPLYFYAASKTLRGADGEGFCVLQPFNGFSPPYCPRYSFHAVDMFTWFLPAYDAARFNYTFTKDDILYSRLIDQRFKEFAATSRIASWRPFAECDTTGAPRLDALPAAYTGIELGPQQHVLPLYRNKQCAFWLKHGFYEAKGLIN